MKNLLKILTLTIFLTSIVSCTDDNKLNTDVVYKATLDGASEYTSNNSAAKGIATLTFNKATKTFKITVEHSVVSPTMGHIHRGAFKLNGPVVFPFSTLVSPITYTSPILTAEQEADLDAGLYYVNLHTAAFPGGEIRGNLIRQ